MGSVFGYPIIFLCFSFPSEAAKIILKKAIHSFFSISQLRPYLPYLSHNFSLFSFEIVVVH